MKGLRGTDKKRQTLVQVSFYPSPQPFISTWLHYSYTSSCIETYVNRRKQNMFMIPGDTRPQITMFWIPVTVIKMVVGLSRTPGFANLQVMPQALRPSLQSWLDLDMFQVWTSREKVSEGKKWELKSSACSLRAKNGGYWHIFFIKYTSAPSLCFHLVLSSSHLASPWNYLNPPFCFFFFFKSVILSLFILSLWHHHTHPYFLPSVQEAAL